jgi:hypothetical protein
LFRRQSGNRLHALGRELARSDAPGEIFQRQETDIQVSKFPLGKIALKVKPHKMR